MKLCFGTYAGILLLCGIKQLTKITLLNAVVQSVDSSCKLTSNAVTSLLQCTSNLPDERSNSLGTVISNAREADPEKVAEYFAAKVIPLLDPNKRKLAAIALREIILSDDTIPDDTVIEPITGTTKNALHTQSGFVLSHFLSGIFLLTAAVDNRIGKEAVKFVTEGFIQSFSALENSVELLQSINASDSNLNKEALTEYFRNLKGKYEKIRTLLYNESHMPFYSFYVPNYLEYSVGRDKCWQLKNVTVESITDLSNFVIIDGMGGLGKSMMMRHLLLNAVKEYRNLRLIPVFVSIKGFSGNSSFTDYIYSELSLFTDRITKGNFVSELKKGTVLLLFDGLDEIGDEHARRFEAEFEAFTDKYSKNFYVISSRPYQSYISFARFTVLRIQPFTKEQSLRLINKLEFRSDEPDFKKRFMAQLNNTLFDTHRSFVENPLLLTIMLMMYEKFADIPAKMHLFYRKAFITLSETHDAGKSGYKRIYKSKLMIDAFEDYFAEFCFRTYRDNKFEFTDIEFAQYFGCLRANNIGVKAADFAYDLCTNLCLMRLDGGKLYFTHRSFQEYFCAVFFSKQKDIFLERLGAFLESRKNRMRGDQMFNMLYDMIPDRVETNIIIPFLEDLFDKCDEQDGYWTFLEIMYPQISYSRGVSDNFRTITPDSYLFEFIMHLIKPDYEFSVDELPEVRGFVIREYGYVQLDDGSRVLADIKAIPIDYPYIETLPDVVERDFEFYITEIRDKQRYAEIREALYNDKFVFKSEYTAAREYLNQIMAKQQSNDDFFADLL